MRFQLFTTFLVALYKVLFDVDSVPHGDTMNGVWCGLPFEDLQELAAGMTATLIDKKVLYPHRLFDRHCPHCLTKKHKNGKVTYYHPVLEAKLVTPTGLVCSLMSDFIENPDDEPARAEQQRKQDCETKAFYRLAARLHARFPRLPLLLAMNGGYATGPVFALCRRYGWKIENEGFNVRKNGGYNLEHAYTKNEHGAKIYYLLLQVARLLMQLMEKGSLLAARFPRGFGSSRNLARGLLEALRNATLTQTQYDELCSQPFQSRFNSS